MADLGNKAQEAKGNVKETTGDAVGDEDLKSEGQADQSESKIKQAGEKVKNAASDVKDSVTGN